MFAPKLDQSAASEVQSIVTFLRKRQEELSQNVPAAQSARELRLAKLSLVIELIHSIETRSYAPDH